MKKSLKTRLIDYLERRGEWVASGHIQRMVAEKSEYTPQNVGRRLREAVEEGYLEVEYRSNNGVQHAYYRRKITHTPEAPKKPEYRVVETPHGAKFVQV